MNIKNITDYIDYLKQSLALSVSVHFSKKTFATLPHSLCVALLPYNSHNNPYCTAVKKTDHEKCIHSQHMLYEKCSPDNGFCRTCFAGVSEYIFPVYHGGTSIGIIAVSGYRSDSASGELTKYLSDSEIPKELCSSVIPPLVAMLERLFSDFAAEPHDEHNLILQYINEYHASLTLDDLAKHFHRSKSHISHNFKARTGKSISEYCNDLKLSDAIKLLDTTDFSVTQIAFDVGFNDSSYFISQFKRKFKTTPLQYRLSGKKAKAFP